MATSSYGRERDLFHASLKIDPERRQIYLRQECQTDEELFGRVERLLAAHSSAEQITFTPRELQCNPLTSWPGAPEQTDLSDVVSSPTPGFRVGMWRLARILGEGGMASVWLANWCDGQNLAPVALKLPHEGWHRNITRERMERERNVLRVLNHPNVARLIDAGVTPEGRPYLVLEYVAGQRIDEHCRLRNLSVAERLHLFLQVARAISHAHNLLIVHRDIKPSNILVAHDGTVRVLDFGIAKLLEEGQTCATELTRHSGQAFTLEYASPEQVAGSSLTVGSDVYSLAVVLYELLTDARPYHLKRCSRAALEEAVLSIEPRPPSTAASTPARRRVLRGDLDTIVTKALRKDPAARYASVEEFADDIERYLQNRPVKAQRDRWQYRLSKFSRRHSLLLSVAVALTTAICLASAAIIWQAHIAVQQRQRAEAVKSFLVSTLFDTHSYWGNGKPLPVVQFLKRMQSRAENLTTADPATRVEILDLLSASLLSQQETEAAEAAALKALGNAQELPPNHRMVLRARMLRSWARLYRGQFFALGNEIDELVLDMRRSPETLSEDLAGALRIRSVVARENDDSGTAEAFAWQALNVAEQRLGLHHNQSVLALVDLSYAFLLGNENMKGLDFAERARQRAYEVYGGKASHPNVVKARVVWAQALAANGRMDEACREMRRAIEDSATLFGPSSLAVGLDMLKLARNELQRGHAGEAVEVANRAHLILTNHFDTAEVGYAGLLEVRGAALFAAHRREQALQDLSRAHGILSHAYGPTHVRTLRVRALRSQDDAPQSRSGNPKTALSLPAR